MLAVLLARGGGVTSMRPPSSEGGNGAIYALHTQHGATSMRPPSSEGGNTSGITKGIILHAGLQ